MSYPQLRTLSVGFNKFNLNINKPVFAIFFMFFNNMSLVTKQYNSLEVKPKPRRFFSSSAPKFNSNIQPVVVYTDAGKDKDFI